MNELADLYVVDDDEDMRDLLAVMFSHQGYRVTGFGEGRSFLAAARVRVPACVILDVHMPERSGLDILREINARRYGAPIFVLSGKAEIPVAVDAIRQGAFDFIEKPFDAGHVLSRVLDGVALWRRQTPGSASEILATAFPGQDLLTPRERDVLAHLVTGESNKEAGRALGISPRTVEVHRARIMDKLHARNTADLMRIVLTERMMH
jgi:FixJ family two-component response regulator